MPEGSSESNNEERDMRFIPEHIKKWIEIPNPVYLGSKSRLKGGKDKFSLDELRGQFENDIANWGNVDHSTIQLIHDELDPNAYHAVVSRKES